MHPDPSLLAYLANQKFAKGTTIQSISRIAVGEDQYTNTYTKSDDSNHAEILQMLIEAEDITRTWLAVVCPAEQGKEQAAFALYYVDRWYAVPAKYIASYREEVEVLNVMDSDDYNYIDWDKMFPDSPTTPLPVG
jgi:hypothetical protein